MLKFHVNFVISIRAVSLEYFALLTTVSIRSESCGLHVLSAALERSHITMNIGNVYQKASMELL